MLDNEPTGAGAEGNSLSGPTTGSTNSDTSAGSTGASAASPTPEPAARPARRRAARRAAGPPAEPPSSASDALPDAVPAAVIAPSPSPEPAEGAELPDTAWPVVPAPVVDAPTSGNAEAGDAAAEPAPRRRASRSRRRATEPATPVDATGAVPATDGSAPADAPVPTADAATDPTPPDVAVEVEAPRARRRRRSGSAQTGSEAGSPATSGDAGSASTPGPDATATDAPAAPTAAAAVDAPAHADAPTRADAAPGDTGTDAAPERAPRRRRRSGAAAAAADVTAPAAPDVTATDDTATDSISVHAGFADSTTTTADAGATADPASAPADVEAAPARRSGRRTASTPFAVSAPDAVVEPEPKAEAVEAPTTHRTRVRRAPMVTFMAPEPTAVPLRPVEPALVGNDAEDEPDELEDVETPYATDEDAEQDAADETAEDDENGDDSRRRRRRGRRGRGRGRGENGGEPGDGDSDEQSGDADEDTEAVTAEGETDETDDEADAESSAEGDDEAGGSRRRRRRRRRGAGDAEVGNDDPPNTVVRVRQPTPAPTRSIEDEVQGVKGSTRLEAKRQRRREGRESSRRRPPVLSEAEFLARREAVERVMVVRQVGDRTQIAVLEDDVLVEHYVTKASSTAYAGNVYLGRVQNVLPSMEAAFVDIGKGRNAVLYAGEVNWDAAGLEGRPRKIEAALRSGDSVLVQVTKDPMGHKGARLTSQVSLPGRFLVYVPEGQMTGISRKLPDTERKRLKDILKKIVPENAGVIIRTAAEGASEAELTHDVERLEAQWQVIKEKATKGGAPALLNAEPDLVIRVIRDVFNEDFTKLVVSGTEAWPEVEEYVRDVSPDLAERLVHHTADTDVFAAYRIDEQLMKALDRKVWLPSGGSLVIDRTEAMTVVDVNTGKFTGQGGNLEETVTRNNLEAAEEIVRQLRLRDIGGIIVIDFIDMVLEGNRDLVLRRLTECLGRDRTKHQVAEVTSLGLVQMTRKRVGQGLLEAFSETCEVCRGRGVILHNEPLISRQSGSANGNGSNSGNNGAGNGHNGHQHGEAAVPEVKEGRRSRRKRGGGGGEPAVAPPAVAAAAAAIHAASTRTSVLDDDDDAEALIVDDVARETVVEGDLAHDVADAEIEAGPDADAPEEAVTAPPTTGLATAHLIAASAEDDAGELVKPADQMVVNGVGLVPVVDEAAPVEAAPAKRPRRARRAASRPAGPPSDGGETE